MLGVQRSTVSAVIKTLQTAGLIRQNRGSITVTDWTGLEERDLRMLRPDPAHLSASAATYLGPATGSVSTVIALMAKPCSRKKDPSQVGA